MLFPDINPKSKSIILNNLSWPASSTGTGEFTIYVCDPDFPSRSAELKRDFFTRDDIQCSVMTMYATFLMSGSQLGLVPAEIMVGQPDLDKRWKDLATLLLAHPEWSKRQVEDAMRASGVKYGAATHNEVVVLLSKSLPKLEPFLGKLIVDSIDYAAPQQTNEKELLPPAWIVKVHPAGQDMSKLWIKYVLVFNVFDGAFQSEQKF